MTSEPVRPTLRADRIKERARELGFGPVGVTHPRPSDHDDFYRAWLAAGLHGEMRYLERDDAVRRRADLLETMPGARSVVVVAHPYFVEDAPGVPEDPSVGVIARYARGRDYHKVVKGKLLELLRWIRSEVDSGVEGRAYVDTGPLLERELAQRAGLGWFGRNTMLIDPRQGSYFFLGALLLDLELDPDAPFVEDRCGTCRACLDACPTGALLGRDETGAPVIDARRCISYLTIEHQGAIPLNLRPLMGNRVYGCDICQEVCPWNERFAEEAAEPGYAARGPGDLPVGVEALPGVDVSAETHPGTEAPSLVELLSTALDEDAWECFSRGSAIRRAGRGGFARNVCVALGNWGSADAVPTLASALSDPEPVVRSHAAWALGRIGSPEASVELTSRLSVEADESVIEELRVALSL
jgi:epoxyqueuosine reductase